jgi:ABC-type methionine transport system permease subunit
MTLEWIGDVILLVVLLPVVIYLLRGVLGAASSIVPSVGRIAAAARAGSADLDATALLLHTQDQTIKTIAAAADYGGSLDVILDDVQGA